MADTANITSNITTGTNLGAGTTTGASITSTVTQGTSITGAVATGGVGPAGDTGAAGANGQGVPAGGTAGQVLAKIDSTNYNTEWVTGGSGAVDSVNAQTGVVVLDADDIDDTSTTHKFVTSVDITKLSNLSGTNTGDQDLSSLVTGPASATDNALARYNTTTGKLIQNSNAVVDDNANLTLSVPSGVQVTKGGLNMTHTNETGTSQYRISQDDYDLLQIKRTGDTTGDGAVWSLIDLHSPTVNSDTEDSESTISLTTRSGTPTSVARTLDIYNDEYSRDNGMGLRQLYKNTTPNPIRFESHDKTTSNGAWTMSGVNVTSGSPNGSYTSTTGVTPAAEDWIWDNAGTYFADDTKILSINTGAKTFVLNRNATGTNASVAARGKNVRESMRITPARQLLVRKHIASSGSTVAEFGGDVVVDGSAETSGISSTITGASSVVPITATLDSSIATQNGLVVQNDTNYAQVGDFALLKAVNVTDTGALLKLENAGTGDYITADSVFSVSKDGTVTGKNIAAAWQTWSPTHTGFSAAPAGGIYRYRYIGDEIEIEIVEPTDGTSNATTFTMTLPVAAATITNMEWVGFANSRNNSAFVNNPSLGIIASAGTVITFWISPNRSTTWGTTNGKRCAYLRMLYRWQ